MDPMYTFNESGVYDVTLTITDDEGLTATDTVTITVSNQSPIAVATATPESGNVPLEVEFTGSSSTDNTDIVSYAWDFGDGNTSSEADPTHTFDSIGTYEVVLTVTDDEGLTGTDTITIQVTEEGGNQAPIAVATANPTEGEAPLAVIFNGAASSDDLAIVTYFWDFGDDSRTSTQVNPVLTYEIPGTYEVSLTVTDSDGLTSTDTVIIVVSDGVENLAPEAVISATPQSGNAPLEVSFTGSGSTDDVEIISYDWDFGDGNNSTEADPSHTYSEAGNYIAELTVTDGEGLTDTATVSINVVDGSVNQAPEAVATATPESGSAPLEVSFNGSGSADDVAVVGYTWDFGDGASSTDANPTHIYDEVGNYIAELTVTDAEGLTGTATISIEVSETEEVIAIIAPNPVPTDAENALIRVRGVSPDIMLINIHLHDATGKFIASFDPALEYNAENDSYEIPVYARRGGLYYITL